MNEIINLHRDDVVIAHPFTHPIHVAPDGTILRDMFCDLSEIVSYAQMATHAAPMRLFFPSNAAWQKRVVLIHPARLLDAPRLAVVGFFGLKYPSIPPEIEDEIFAVGGQLIDAFADHPGVLAYYTMLLADGVNYANLVVLDKIETISAWRAGNHHQYATSVLSPQYYQHVRIYNGLVPLDASTHQRQLQLTKVKYFDYTCVPFWQAVRELDYAAVIYRPGVTEWMHSS